MRSPATEKLLACVERWASDLGNRWTPTAEDHEVAARLLRSDPAGAVCVALGFALRCTLTTDRMPFALALSTPGLDDTGYGRLTHLGIALDDREADLLADLEPWRFNGLRRPVSLLAGDVNVMNLLGHPRVWLADVRASASPRPSVAVLDAAAEFAGLLVEAEAAAEEWVEGEASISAYLEDSDVQLPPRSTLRDKLLKLPSYESGEGRSKSCRVRRDDLDRLAKALVRNPS